MSLAWVRKYLQGVVILSVLALGAWFVGVNAMSLHELSYNEGWNVYNAAAFARHTLYPTRFGLVSNNYPMLSFALFSALHHVTHDYLYTGRAVSCLSLVGLCFLIARICWQIGLTNVASRLAAAFCFCLFTLNIAEGVDGSLYVGADDPNMLALFLSMAGLSFYLDSVQKKNFRLWLLVSAVLFTLSLSVKHTLLDVPFIVFLDQAVRNWKRAGFFFVSSAALLATSLGLQIHAAGPGFVLQLLAPRTYLAWHEVGTFVDLFGPTLIPALIACFTAWKVRHDHERRIATWLFLGGLTLGFYTGRADGVTYNCFFSAEVALCLLMGIFLSKLQVREWFKGQQWLRETAATLLFTWFLVPLILFSMWNPRRVFTRAQTEQESFREQVSLIRSSPKPALCESLLRCYFAGKPYLYDPFNATRLIRTGKISDLEIVHEIRAHRYGTIQLDDSTQDEVTYHSERFVPDLLSAISECYKLTYQKDHVFLYSPRSISEATAEQGCGR